MATAAIVGGTLAAAYMSSRASKSAAKSAAKTGEKSLDAQMEMYYQTREDQQPYQDYADEWRSRYKPINKGMSEYDLGGTPNLNQFTASPDSAVPNTPNLGNLQYGQEANLPQFQQQLPGSLQNFAYDPNQSDNVTNYLREQAKERTDQELAARGLQDSSTAIEQLANADMNVLANQQESQYGRAVGEYGMGRDNVMALAQEYQTKYGMDANRAMEMANRDMAQYQATNARDIDTYNMDTQRSNTLYGRETGENALENQRLTNQYGMDYGQSMDQFNINNQLENQQYNKFIDAQKIGQGAASAAGAATPNIGSTYNAIAQNQLAAGQNQAALYAGMGAIPANAIATNYYMNNMNTQQQPVGNAYQYGYGPEGQPLGMSAK